MEKCASSKCSTLFWSLGIVAALVVGFFVGKSLTPGDNVQNPTATVAQNAPTRSGGGYADIEELIGQNECVVALDKIEQELRRLDNECSAIIKDSSLDEDQKAYELGLINGETEDLQWLKVQAFLGLERIENARGMLDVIRFSNSPYRDEAETLYQKLNNAS